MNLVQIRRAGALLLAGTLAMAGCAADKGADGKSCSVTDNGNGSATVSCPDGTSATVNNGTNGQDGTFNLLTAADRADLDPATVITAVSIGIDGRPVVGFKVNDRHGNGVKGLVAQATTVRLGILKLAAPGVNGSANETWVSYDADSAASTSSYETPTTAGAVMTDNGDGTYAFKFAKDITAGATAGTTYEPTRIHRVVALIYTSGNPYAPMNAVFDFVPATGEVKPVNDQETVDGAACLQCHGAFRAKAGQSTGFHGGSRYLVSVCVLCHNDQSRFISISGNNKDDSAIDSSGVWTGNLVKLNGESTFNLPVFIHKIHMGEELTLKVFIHKIHMGEELTLKGGTYRAVAKPWEVTYPQDVRNCAKCHKTNGRSTNWKDVPSRRACGACHDGITFTGQPLNARTGHFVQIDNDITGAPGSTGCNGCHPAATIAGYHTPVAAPNIDSSYANTTSGNANTNAGWLPAVNALPANAAKIWYEVDSVTTTAASNPQIVFRMMKQEPNLVADFVTFNPTTSTEMMDNYVGSSSIYFAFAVSQSGIEKPADWNSTISAYLKNVWKGTNATLTGPVTKAASGTTPATGGWYTATITNGKVPASARLLTGGVGYSYSLTSTQPLTQTNVPNYPYNGTGTAVTCGPKIGTGGVTVLCNSPTPRVLQKKEGGLVVAAPNVWKTAKNHTARRTIVSNAKCNACHDQLGSIPTFHAGQRNDAPTCAFCHTPNRTSSGWSANAKDFIHAIHGGAKREVPFTWHAVSATDTFAEVTFPGILRRCTTCHLDQTAAGDSTFDYSANASALESLLPSVDATGKFDPASPTSFAFSPYVAVDNVTDYGTGFSFTAVRRVPRLGAGEGPHRPVRRPDVRAALRRRGDDRDLPDVPRQGQGRGDPGRAQSVG